MTDHEPHPAAVPGYIHNKDDQLKRLRRIEGQIRGLQRMVEEEKYCIDILTQVSAATKALEAVALGLLDDHLRHCMVHVAQDPGQAMTTRSPRPPPLSPGSCGRDRTSDPAQHEPTLTPRPSPSPA